MTSSLEDAFDGAFRGKSSSRRNQSISRPSDSAPKAAPSVPASSIQKSSIMHRVLMDYDPLLLKANEYPFVTRYIGGRVLSFFTLSMVICSVVLIVLTSLIYTEYKPAAESLRDSYLVDGASVSYATVVSTFLANITSAKVLVDNGVAYSKIFPLSQGIITIVKVVSPETPYYVRGLWTSDRTSVAVVSNQPDCAVSSNYVCDNEILGSDIREFDWYKSGSKLGVGEYMWSAPVPYTNSTSGAISNSIDLIWKTSGNVLNLISVEANINYSENRLLHGNVWLVHSQTELIVNGLNVDWSEIILVEHSTSPVSLVGQTLKNISQAGDVIFPIPKEYQLFTDTVVRSVANSPYCVVVSSDASSFDDDNISAYSLAGVVVAALPLLATSLVLGGYLLRLVAIERKKRRRREELSEANVALEAMKMRRLAEVESLRSRKSRLAASRVSERLTEAGSQLQNTN